MKDLYIRYIYDIRYNKVGDTTHECESGLIFKGQVYAPIRTKVGMVVGKPSKDGLMVGWSLCDERDKFDKEAGIKTALSRACTDEVHDIEHIKEHLRMQVVKLAYILKSDYEIDVLKEKGLIK